MLRSPRGRLRETLSSPRRQSPILNVARLNFLVEFPARRRRHLPFLPRLMMRPLLLPSMPSRLRNCWLALRNLMKNSMLREATELRLRRAAPCSRRTLKTFLPVLRRLDLTLPLRLSSTRRERENLPDSRESSRSLILPRREHLLLSA